MYFPVLLWSLVIFASYWGYGEALRRMLKRPEFDDLCMGYGRHARDRRLFDDVLVGQCADTDRSRSGWRCIWCLLF